MAKLSAYNPRKRAKCKAWRRCIALTAACILLVAITKGGLVITLAIPWLLLAIELNNISTQSRWDATQLTDINTSESQDQIDGETPMMIEQFQHDETTLRMDPEAQGHFCLLWGDHGHGGYCSQSNAYIQGGQPMDSSFELAEIYIDFGEAKTAKDWNEMRACVHDLRQQRIKMNLSQAEEREWREDPDPF